MDIFNGEVFMQILYIYKITNNLNGKIYVGKHSSNRLENQYFGSGVAIKAAIRKYGKDNFSKEIICICDNEGELNKSEIMHIKESGAFANGYNMTLGGEGKLGYKPSEKQKKKQSETMVKFFKDHPEIRKKISESSSKMTGDKNSFYGKRLTKEHIEKMRVARVKAISGANNYMAVKVRCLDTGVVYGTAAIAAKDYRLKHSTTILKAAKGHRKTAGGVKWELA